jgi:methionyl-tRNA synthetase
MDATWLIETSILEEFKWGFHAGVQMMYVWYNANTEYVAVWT